MVVSAANTALDLKSPRGLDYVRILSGAAHRDLFELAAQSPTVAFADAARAILDSLATN